ncbi:MAG: hypothetical protein COS35_04835 [Zetaproteobacteria bacterium CG02_land_8_20_14_3_00_50_9]|nr:MAG: hypothetical protein AUJ57_02375 [Zetaproteobacteria bacterium CG1_02_53_45]PIQ32379.1 MAG: hypothetical protein COW62_07770 [Zetaproteobacteria bacterium CG17_big_fil_post_rev_8_21_14_2_50_50_13]PIV30800.1 MAG: hypothetical protein COS35_04835 [Zetaproteobacteria bacterium CG02_land_8_20_14_3_00_50_9]PIY54690.1 MAG: hypothetical protein COZ00_13440 [Zetaproteobacteria bacterium CG_4_10_14_0_8_um_filter_49_80]
MLEFLKYNLKYRLLARLLPFALVIGCLIWIAFNYAVSDVAETIGQYVAEKQALYDRSRIMAPICGIWL